MGWRWGKGLSHRFFRFLRCLWTGFSSFGPISQSQSKTLPLLTGVKRQTPGVKGRFPSSPFLPLIETSSQPALTTGQSQKLPGCQDPTSEAPRCCFSLLMFPMALKSAAQQELFSAGSIPNHLDPAGCQKAMNLPTPLPLLPHPLPLPSWNFPTQTDCAHTQGTDCPFSTLNQIVQNKETLEPPLGERLPVSKNVKKRRRSPGCFQACSKPFRLGLRMGRLV